MNLRIKNIAISTTITVYFIHTLKIILSSCLPFIKTKSALDKQLLSHLNMDDNGYLVPELTVTQHRNRPLVKLYVLSIEYAEIVMAMANECTSCCTCTTLSTSHLDFHLLMAWKLNFSDNARHPGKM